MASHSYVLGILPHTDFGTLIRTVAHGTGRHAASSSATCHAGAAGAHMSPAPAPDLLAYPGKGLLEEGVTVQSCGWG